MPRTKNPKPTRHVSYRLPSDLLAALDACAAEVGLSKTKTLELALWKGLGRGPHDAPAPLPDPAQMKLFG